MSSLGVPHLHRLWSAVDARRTAPAPFAPDEWAEYDVALRGLHVDLHEALAVLHGGASLDAFERWILEQNGGSVPAERIERLNAALAGEAVGGDDIDGEPVFSAEEMQQWDERGYVVLHDAVEPGACGAAADAIWSFLGMDRDDPDTWYAGPHGRTIWVPLLRHEALWANRRAPRVMRAFAQLWGRRDLWMTVDQVGFNPPERPGWRFPGPYLHWDASLVPPIGFDVQALLYLCDVGPEQGAFTCVPGFHRRIEAWLRELPAGADPRTQDLYALGAEPVAGRAGDLIVWHHALPHGASPNRARRPRLVQYLKMQPLRRDVNAEWR